MNRNVWGRSLIFGLTSLAVVGSLPAQLINGDFETPNISSQGTVFSPGGAQYLTVNTGAPTLTGWAVGGSTIDIVRQGTDYQAYDGSQFLDLAGTPGPGNISQTLTLLAGTGYQLTFAYANNPGSGTRNLDVAVTSVGGSMMGDLYTGSFQRLDTNTTANLGWTVTTVFFTTPAGGGNVTLFFGDQGGGNAGIFLDGVTVAVPEPGTWLAGGLAMVGCGAFVARRRRSRLGSSALCARTARGTAPPTLGSRRRQRWR